MYGRRKTLALAFICLLVMSILRIEADPAAPQEFTLHTKNLGLLFHRATTASLLQSKARKELEKLADPIQSTLYSQCVNDSRNLLSLAKCVAKVLDERDQRKLRKVQKECEAKEGDFDGGWLGQFFNAVFGGLDCVADSTKISSTANQTSRTRLEKLDLFKKRYEKVKFVRQQRRKIKTFRMDAKKRPKRSVQQRWPTSPNECRKTLPDNVKGLRRVEHYFGQLNEVIGYVYEVSKSNERFFQNMSMQVNYTHSAHLDPTRRQLDEFVSRLESFDDRAVVSILSPRLLNLLPQTPRIDPESKDWLSPNMLSFQDEGMLPLPKLLQMSTSNHCETLEWLDLLMHMSGASKMINSMVGKFGSHMEQIENEVHPRVQESRKHEQKFERLHSLNTDAQLKELGSHGFTQMSHQQMLIAYGSDGIHADSPGLEFHEDEDIEAELESEIRQMSKMSDAEFKQKVNEHLGQRREHRGRRQKRDWIDTVLPMTSQKQIGGLRVLNPFAFTQRVRNANIMGPYILSPYAFFVQLFAPTIIGGDYLSPRAFVATIFSPVILVARVLSPAAFRMMLFSPLMLAVWVLVPESFSLKLFSPKLLEARILSSDSFSFILLSPAAGIMRAGSPNAFTILVLSPAVATYQLFSGNRNVIQILSPGILGIDEKPLLKERVDELRTEARRTGRPLSTEVGPASLPIGLPGASHLPVSGTAPIGSPPWQVPANSQWQVPANSPWQVPSSSPSG